MISSMTGFGSAAFEEGPRRVAVEIRTVNHRYLKVLLKMPKAIGSLETELEALVRQHISRGTVTANLLYHDASMLPSYRIDQDAIRAYQGQVAELARSLSLPEAAVDLTALLTLPGAICSEDEGGVAGVLAPEGRDLVLRGLTEALNNLNEARAEEGAHLLDVLVAHGTALENSLDVVTVRAPSVPRAHRDRLLTRVRQLLTELEATTQVTEADLLRELCLLADKTDVTEEMNRLRGHLTRYRDILATGGEVGRRLDFLLQEMLRETNTIGSKANDPDIVHAVVEMKCEIERMKEQVQNLE